LSLIHRWEDATTPARLTLSQLVARSSREVLNEHSRSVGDLAITVQREPAFRPRTQNNRLWFELKGGAVVSRYFAMHPDSVTFAFEQFGVRKLACTARVEYQSARRNRHVRSAVSFRDSLHDATTRRMTRRMPQMIPG
jgi:hypothetical protein